MSNFQKGQILEFKPINSKSWAAKPGDKAKVTASVEEYQAKAKGNSPYVEVEWLDATTQMNGGYSEKDFVLIEETKQTKQFKVGNIVRLISEVKRPAKVGALAVVTQGNTIPEDDWNEAAPKEYVYIKWLPDFMQLNDNMLTLNGNKQSNGGYYPEEFELVVESLHKPFISNVEAMKLPWVHEWHLDAHVALLPGWDIL